MFTRTLNPSEPFNEIWHDPAVHASPEAAAAYCCVNEASESSGIDRLAVAPKFIDRSFLLATPELRDFVV